MSLQPHGICIILLHLGGEMTTYRRGLELKRGSLVWQKLWHFNDGCADFPERNFASREDRPDDTDVCSRCKKSRLALMLAEGRKLPLG